MNKTSTSLDQLLAIAQQHGDNGRPDQARQVYRMILSMHPDDATALRALDQLRLEAGEGDATGPDEAELEALSTLFSAGKLDAAGGRLHQLLQQYPRSAWLHNAQGVVFSQQGRMEAAAAALEKALSLDPGFIEAHMHLGNIYRLANDFQSAARHFRQAVERRPDYADAWINLGASLRNLERQEEALQCYEKVLELQPESPVAFNNLGNALRDLHRVEEAIAYFKKAVSLAPDYTQAIANLGHAQADLGDMAAAIASYEQVLQRQPGHAEVHESLSELKTFTTADTQVDQMERLLAMPETGDADRVHLNFALGKAYADLGDYDRSFSHYAEGNRLYKAAGGYRLDKDRQLFASIETLFLSTPPAAAADPTEASVTPIFITGMPRSGTTLAEQILASHSRVHGAGELQTLNQLIAPVLPDLLARVGTATASPITEEFIAKLRGDYLRAISALAGGKQIVTNKMPMNFLWTGFIAAAFPEAKIINLSRDPVATIWSIYRRYFKSAGHGYAYDLLDLAGYYKLYLDLMDFWRQRFPGRIYDLNYETLTSHQARETAKLLAYCNLEWEDTCMDFHQTRRVVRTASLTQVRTPMFTGSGEAWKKYSPHLEPLLQALDEQSVTRAKPI